MLDDLDEIHFTMKKARQVIRDMARGLATDRCIMTLLLLVVIAIVVLVVLKILHIPKKNSVKLPGPTVSARGRMHAPQAMASSARLPSLSVCVPGAEADALGQRLRGPALVSYPLFV